jgi:membrane-bound lytic murein transglycosylase A
LAREAVTDFRRFWRCAAALGAIAAALSLISLNAIDARRSHPEPAARHLPYPQFDLPIEITGSQYSPLAWSDIPGWDQDDHLAAFQAFRSSCKPIAAQQVPPAASPPATPKPLGMSLREPCEAARNSKITDAGKARVFFEEHFVPLEISRLGEGAGFVTGYYEPIIEGSRTQTELYNVPVYRRPSNLFVRGYSQDAPDLPNKGPVYRKIGRRKLVPYYDRAEIEDGAIAGRGLEICWLKSQTDLLFAQIQGSARVKLEDGATVRINYDAHNGYPYTPVGRILIDRGIIPKEEMSMQRIREWMEQNPDGAKELRRQNRAYVFFRVVHLSDQDEAVGAQGVPLTPGRSIAVDKGLHVYGTPFFIEGELPIDSAQSKTPFHRLMIAQDTGSAITGPARADLYFGAGADAGKVSGRLKHNMRFVMLVPKSLDPVARGHKMPVPDARPSAKIAKLFPQTDPAKDQVQDQVKDQAKDGRVEAPPQATPPASADPKGASPVPQAKGPGAATPSTTIAQASDASVSPAAAIPLPEPRPHIEREHWHHRTIRRYYRDR